MVTILMMSAKKATPGLLKIKVFWNEGYDVIISLRDVTNKILSCDLNYIVDVVMWSKFGNSSISMREVIITSILSGFDQKKYFFWEVVLVQVQWFGTDARYGLELYTSVVKGSKLKVRKFWGLLPTFVEFAREKLVGGAFPPSWIVLKNSREGSSPNFPSNINPLQPGVAFL